MLSNHHHYLIIEHFHHLKQNSGPFKQYSSPLPSTPGNLDSIFCLHTFDYSRYFINNISQYLSFSVWFISLSVCSQGYLCYRMFSISFLLKAE